MPRHYLPNWRVNACFPALAFQSGVILPVLQ